MGKVKQRGNGTGCVFQRGKTWTAIKTISWSVDDDLKLKRKTISKGGFHTKREALAYLPFLVESENRNRNPTFAEIYEGWEAQHDAGPSTMDCYHAAYKHFSAIHHYKLSDIDIDDLQECADECPNGKRTRQNMKALAGLLYKYAIPRHMADLNLGQYLRVRGEAAPEHDALPMEAVKRLLEARDYIPYAGHIVCQCYLGFRPSELLALDARDYDRQNRAFIGGAKTDAGRNRIVTISPKIQPIIDALTRDKISGQVFCREDGQKLNIKAYRQAFYNALDAIDFDNPIIDGRRKYTPHSCRHTFATMLKQVKAPDQDKLRIIGHTSTAMLRHYQDTDLDALRRITDAI